MNSKRLYYILIGSIGLLVIALVGGAYGADILLSKQADQLVEAKARSIALETEQQQLLKSKNDIVKYKSLSDIAKSIVPQDKDQAQAIREIVNLANANNIRLGAITFPSSNLGTATAAPRPAAEPTASGDAAATTPKPAPLPQSQLKAVPSIPGVFDLAITVQSDTSAPADYNQLIKFLAALENNRRTAIVSGVSLTPDSKDPNRIAFTLNINEYIKP